MKKYLLLTGLLMGSLVSYLQPSYRVDSIPEALRKAPAVKRFEQLVFVVHDYDRATLEVHRVFTVLHSKGASKLFFDEYTDQLRKIDDVDIRVYDASGKQTARYRKKDLNKQAVYSGLTSDGMRHYLQIGAPVYPVTVEYRYQIEYSGTLIYPSWLVQEEDEAVEYSSYTAKVASGLGIRYKNQKIDVKPVITSAGKSEEYRWEVRHLLPYDREEGVVSSRFFYPSVLLAPNKFRHFNSMGDLSSWTAFGKWGYDLMKGLDDLPEERKQFFRTLVQDASNDREKAERIYEYLQKNFRYVSIQLGIGGVKPFSANFTDQKKYGDCKGLSFYMYAALNAVGIKSYCAWINAGYNSEAVDPAFPCDRFNHAILCIPGKTDSIWLECTSNTSEFGQLGTFTENRNALLLTEEGGKLVATPSSRSESNLLSSTTRILLSGDGSGTSSTNLITRGEYRELINQMIAARKDDQKNYVVRSLGFRQPDAFQVSSRKGMDPSNVDINLSLEKIPQFMAGSKMFLSPRINELWASGLPKSEDRKQDFYFHSPFLKFDTTIYVLPEGYVPEVLPESGILENQYASYRTGYTYHEEKRELVSTVQLELKRHHIPAADYAEVKSFFDKVLSGETQKLVISRQ